MPNEIFCVPVDPASLVSDETAINTLRLKKLFDETINSYETDLKGCLLLGVPTVYGTRNNDAKHTNEFTYPSSSERATLANY